uniref:Uncharacterized protein n=1 Tax=Lotharella globosa TaxID=91324 RepID=A0A7S3ZFS1_9EUKA
MIENYWRRGRREKKTFGVRDSTSYSLVVRGCVRNGLALVAELLLKEMNELHMTTPQALRMEVDVALRKFRDDLSLLPRKAIELRDRNLPEKKPSRQKVKDGYSDDEDDDGDAEEDVDMDEDHGADESSIAPQLDPSAAAAKWMIEETAQLLTGRSQEAFIQFVKAPTEDNAWQGFEGLDLEGIFSKLKMMVEDMWNEGHLRRPEADFVKWRLLLSSRKVEEELILEEIMEKKFEEEGGAAGLAWTRDLPKGPEEPWASSARLEELTNKHEKQLPKNLGKVAKARRYRGTRKKGRKTMRKVLKKRR